MSAVKILREAAAIISLAGPLLERFAQIPGARDIVRRITDGVAVALDVIDRLEDASGEYAERVSALLEEFRALQVSGGVTPDDFRAQADRIRDKTAALRDSVIGPGG